VFLRGGMDGLNIVVPYADTDYRRLRPNIGIAAPGATNGAIAVDNFFGINPALAPIKPLFDAGRVSFVHATGLAQQSRSHFECQDRMERASLDLASVTDGWLGRHLAVAGDGSTFQGIGVGTAVQPALRGSAPALGLSSIEAFTLRTSSPRKDDIAALLDLMYDRTATLDLNARKALEALDQLEAANPGAIPVEGGAAYPATAFGNEMKEVAQLIKADLGLKIACVDLGGWDHHNAEAAALTPLLDELSKTIAALDADLGARRGNVSLVTMTEFGRRAKENASNGTDHGSAYAMMVYGSLSSGKVWADWPTLADNRLRDGDLDITIDYRTVLTELLEKRGGGTDVAKVFPGYTRAPSLGIFAAR
jgi:uncharacterized protein (DUF1501 family)